MDGTMKTGARTYGGATLQVSIPRALPEHMQERVREVTNVFTDPKNRKQGNASELLRRLVTEADRDQTVLMLTPKPEHDEPVELHALINWYHRYSFQLIQDEPPLMARQPRH